MTNIVYLVLGEDFPTMPDRWIKIERNHNGKYLASGSGISFEGYAEQYRSQIEDEFSLGRAISSALNWAQIHEVPTIWVRDEPS